MKKIWYLLKCPEGNEADYVKAYQEAKEQETEGKSDKAGLQEAIHFQCQRLMRYRGQWHLEKREILPGYVFLSRVEIAEWKQQTGEKDRIDGNKNGSLTLCETPFLKQLCPDGNLVGMSRGIIRHGIPIVTSGPLQGKEHLIRKINRHKRTAEIEIPLEGKKKWVTVGLEIYDKQ